MTYLILHKVRGEPAFDIADKLQIGDEEGWIIPTSGHRAYPIDHWPLDVAAPFTKACRVPDNFEGWPDHYECNDKGTALPAGTTIMSIISKLMPKMKDRRF